MARRIQEEKNKMLAAKIENEKACPDHELKKRAARGPKPEPRDEDVCMVDLVLRDIRRGSFNLRRVKCQDEKRI